MLEWGFIVKICKRQRVHLCFLNTTLCLFQFNDSVGFNTMFGKLLGSAALAGGLTVPHPDAECLNGNWWVMSGFKCYNRKVIQKSYWAWVFGIWNGRLGLCFTHLEIATGSLYATLLLTLANYLQKIRVRHKIRERFKGFSLVTNKPRCFVFISQPHLLKWRSSPRLFAVSWSLKYHELR